MKLDKEGYMEEVKRLGSSLGAMRRYNKKEQTKIGMQLIEFSKMSDEAGKIINPLKMEFIFAKHEDTSTPYHNDYEKERYVYQSWIQHPSDCAIHTDEKDFTHSDNGGLGLKESDF